MVRRVLSFLALLGHVIGQLAAVPHAHAAGGAPKHHHSRPHIHLGASHDHHHHDRSHGAAHLDDVAINCGEQDHEGDAVYLQPVVANSPSAGQCHVDDLTNHAPSHWLPALVLSPDLTTASSALCEPHSDLTGGHCALFLTLQTLRI